MKVREAMTQSVCIVRPDQTIEEAARLMSEFDVGALPVGENDRLVGMITDRDMAIRAIAQGLGPDAKVRDIMTAEVMYCFDHQDLADVGHNMSDIQVRRLPVVDREKHLVGIVSLCDIAVIEGTRAAGEALSGISRPGGEHSQTA